MKLLKYAMMNGTEVRSSIGAQSRSFPIRECRCHLKCYLELRTPPSYCAISSTVTTTNKPMTLGGPFRVNGRWRYLTLPGVIAVRKSDDVHGRRGVAASLGYGPGQILIHLLSPFVRCLTKLILSAISFSAALR